MATGSEAFASINSARKRGVTGASRRRPIRATPDRAAMEAVGF
jgi:hypothetical protein